MKTGLSRRGLIGLVPSALLVPSAALGSRTQAGSVHPLYPSHHPDAVKEIVSMSHGNLERVREMLKVTPALAKSAWDWGFGDWETPLAAAAHTGQAEIARLLMENGAQPDVFAFAMFGCGADVGEAESGDSAELGAAWDYFAGACPVWRGEGGGGFGLLD